jgi:large subunit ribosomal protein L23
MTNRTPYDVIKTRHITEKSVVLQELHTSESNKSTRRCKQPKFVFIVDVKATKPEIKQALEMIYAERNIKVTDVNTINVGSKQRRVRGRVGFTAAYKKAIVTLREGDKIDEV